MDFYDVRSEPSQSLVEAIAKLYFHLLMDGEKDSADVFLKEGCFDTVHSLLEIEFSRYTSLGEYHNPNQPP
jgi:hypothetical protein